MGRPVNKRNFGALADGTNLTINCKVAGNGASAVGMIKRQRSNNKFLVDDAKDDTGNEGVCTLVNKASGSLGANVRYTYAISDDSTVSQLLLTAI